MNNQPFNRSKNDLQLPLYPSYNFVAQLILPEGIHKYELLEFKDDGLSFYLPENTFMILKRRDDGEVFSGWENRLNRHKSTATGKESWKYASQPGEVEVGEYTFNHIEGGINIFSVFIDNTELLITSEDEQTVDPIVLKPSELHLERTQLIRYLHRDQLGLPPYLDKFSPHYAPELALAVELHEALIINGQRRFPDLESDIDQWLKSNRPKINRANALIKRLATIINNHKKRGHPVTY